MATAVPNSPNTTQPSANLPTVLIALSWGLDAVGGVSEVAKGLIRSAKRDGQFNVEMLLNDWDHVVPRAVHTPNAIETRVRIVDPWTGGKTLRQGLFAWLQFPLNPA